MKEMNNILLTADDQISEFHYSLKDQFRLDHIHNILKLEINDSVRLCHINKGLSKGRITQICKDEVLIKTDEFKNKNLPWVDLLIGLSRPPTCKKVIEHGSTLGVGQFHFFKAELSEKSYLQSKLFKEKQYEKLIELGLSQSGVYHQLPELKLSVYNPLNDYKNIRQKYILSLETESTFADENIDFSRPTLLAIGPERGWTANEISLFKENGFKEISISSSILRVETAVFTSLGQLELLKMQQQ
jgi:RsmE family RNA methyltransferase